MLRTAVRTIVTLLVLSLLAAGICWLVQSNSSVLGAGAGLDRQGPPAVSGALSSQGFQEGGFPGQGRDFEGGGGTGIGVLGIIKNLSIFSLVTAGVIAVQKFIPRLFRRRAAGTV